MKQILQKRIQGEALTFNEAFNTLVRMGKGEINNSQMAAFLTTYMMKPITPMELDGFRAAMLELAFKIDLSEFDAMDIVGTGGDGKNTFNISTTSSFVVAGTGQKVAKHGNHGVSSLVGSSTVLEYLGVKFSNDVSFLKEKLEKSGICFFHAALFHPGMKYVAPIRKELGLKNFFNILGPLINPANVKKQLNGVFNEEVLGLYGDILKNTDKKFGVLFALDGYDEISLTGDFKLISRRGEQRFSPKDLGFKTYSAKDLECGSGSADSARILISILENKGTEAQMQVVLANAAMALYVVDEQSSFEDCYLKAKESIESGNALRCFKNFIS